MPVVMAKVGKDMKKTRRYDDFVEKISVKFCCFRKNMYIR